jgi:hypothetical protein
MANFQLQMFKFCLRLVAWLPALWLLENWQLEVGYWKFDRKVTTQN